MKVRTNTCFDKDPRVEMVSLVGSGGNGQCFLLKIEDQYRILKKFFPYSIDSMNNEIFALEKHKNPFMPILYDKSTNHPTEKNSWILTDYIPGPNLFEIMHSGYEGYRLKRLVMLKILKGITLQLTMMNKSNLKHRDLKPENILIDAHLIPHIIDHGNSSTENNNSERKSSGTIPYTAPEVLKNNNSSKSDIYSLGGIIFYMLTEHFPYDDAYKTLDGLKKYVKNVNEIPNIVEKYYESSIDINDNKDIRQFIDQQIEATILERKVDNRFIHDKEFLEADPFSAKLVKLIDMCWEYNPETRISHEDIMTFLDETAQEFLDNQEIIEYKQYSADISEVARDTEYGTIENIEAAFDNGLYHANETLKSLLSYNFEVSDDEEQFCSSFQSISPHYNYFAEIENQEY